jgi:hypothetical protein
MTLSLKKDGGENIYEKKTPPSQTLVTFIGAPLE